MIKLKDLLTEAQLSRYQIFSPGTGGSNFKFNPEKVPTGKLKVGNFFWQKVNRLNALKTLAFFILKKAKHEVYHEF